MLTATLLAVGSAFIHAGWNLLVKTSGDRRISAWGIVLMGGVISVPLLLVVGPPGVDALPWLTLSAVIHIGYIAGIAAAYTHGDFSLSYPIARGAGALLAAIGGVVLLGDHLSTVAWLGLTVVAVGLLALRGRGRAPGLGWALFTGLCIGGYTVADSHGARLSASGVSYGIAVIVGVAIAVSASSIARGQGPDLLAALPRHWRRWALGGIGLTAAYTMVMVAVRLAPVGYVTMLRESSVVIGALLGWLVLREPMAQRRIMASGVMLCGLLILVSTG